MTGKFCIGKDQALYKSNKQMKKITEVRKIDLHMHTLISDGTDSPPEILEKVKETGIELFSVTDHDAVMASAIIKDIRREDDPLFISGAEFSCKDAFGKYHILGYGYEAHSGPINILVAKGHGTRMEKFKTRLKRLKEDFGITFSQEDIDMLYENKNPGKPHIANLMVKYKYVKSKEDAFYNFLNKINIPNIYIQPEEAISAILQSGGIPILAHPSYGSGDEFFTGDEMEERLKRLMGMGIKGVEGFYSGFSMKMENEICGLAEKYDLYVTAGSDYHGKNKFIELGQNNLNDALQGPKGLRRFLEDVPLR